MEQKHQTILESRVRESELRARESDLRARECETRANDHVRDCSKAVNELTLTKKLLEVMVFQKNPL